LVTVSNLNLFSASAGLVLQNAIENKGTKSTLFVLYGKKHASTDGINICTEKE
jgi:hypothetical protein